MKLTLNNFFNFLIFYIFIRMNDISEIYILFTDVVKFYINCKTKYYNKIAKTYDYPICNDINDFLNEKISDQYNTNPENTDTFNNLIDELNMSIENEILKNISHIDPMDPIVAKINDDIKNNNIQIKQYLNNVIWKDFFEDYYKCIFNFNLNLDNMYFLDEINKNEAVIVKLLDINNKITIPISTGNNINKINPNMIKHQYTLLWYNLTNGEITYYPELYNDIKTEYKFYSTLKLEPKCKNIFWKYYYLAEKSLIKKIIYFIKQEILLSKELYNITGKNTTYVMNNIIDTIGKYSNQIKFSNTINFIDFTNSVKGFNPLQISSIKYYDTN